LVTCVVEHEQQPTVAEVAGQRFQQRLGRILCHLEDLRHGRGNQHGIRDRREVHEEHTVGKAVDEAGGHPKRKPGLTGPPGPGEGHQSGRRQKLLDLLDLTFPPHERGQLRGKVARFLQGLEPGELGGESFDPQLVQAHAVRQVLQAMGAEVQKAHPFGQPVRCQCPRGPRQ
jgi:hypothetical protein